METNSPRPDQDQDLIAMGASSDTCNTCMDRFSDAPDNVCDDCILNPIKQGVLSEAEMLLETKVDPPYINWKEIDTYVGKNIILDGDVPWKGKPGILKKQSECVYIVEIPGEDIHGKPETKTVLIVEEHITSGQIKILKTGE